MIFLYSLPYNISQPHPPHPAYPQTFTHCQNSPLNYSHYSSSCRLIFPLFGDKFDSWHQYTLLIYILSPVNDNLLSNFHPLGESLDPNWLQSMVSKNHKLYIQLFESGHVPVLLPLLVLDLTDQQQALQVPGDFVFLSSWVHQGVSFDWWYKSPQFITLQTYQRRKGW